MGETNIEWTHLPGYRGASWNVLRGCSRVSDGCRNCYAETLAARFSDPGMAYEGLARRSPSGPRWTGEVRFVAEKLSEPLRARKPTCYFVNSMSDLFHEKVSDEQIAAMFGVMAACPQHRFLALTKRAERMAAWFEYIAERGRFYSERGEIEECFRRARQQLDEPGVRGNGYLNRLYRPAEGRWPLPWVWLGVSVEDQATADERIPHLLRCPAAVRWISLEPQLGPVDLRDHLCGCCEDHDEGRAEHDPLCNRIRGLDWVVQGGESGPGARWFDLAWASSVRDQCAAEGVPYFLKQLGSAPKLWSPGDRPPFPRLRDRKGGDMEEWPADLRVRQWPEVKP